MFAVSINKQPANVINSETVQIDTPENKTVS